MNWETGKDHSESQFQVGRFPWRDMEKESEHRHVVVYKKHCPGGRIYRLSVSKWEIAKMEGRLRDQKVIEGTRRFRDWQ